MHIPEKEHVLVYTDDGRDVDDIEALVYLAGCPEVQIEAVVTTHMIPDRRAMIARSVLDNLGVYNIPVGVGSIYPLGKEDESLVSYLRQHTVHGRTYEGSGLIECFPNGVELIGESIDRLGDRLKIAVCAPMTDLAKAAVHDPSTFKRLGGLFIQGQAVIENGSLSPDPEAYNLKEDLEAAEIVFRFQNDVPFTFVGKHAAYELPLHRADFTSFAATGNPVGVYMLEHAIKGIECFAERAPEVFSRVFGLQPDQLDILDELSKPYDALVAKAIARPDGLLGERFGQHTLVGMSPSSNGIENPHLVKQDITTTIINALERGTVAQIQDR